ncbi:MAG: hypothetical protein N2442_09175 [Spirochaetes bacterium]|nr:hypothetical protein [Spirochaetota bacterium]
MASPAKKRCSPPKTRKEILLKEIAQIAPLLAEENLEFLKHQAEVLLHSARMGSLNQQADLTPPAGIKPGEISGV